MDKELLILEQIQNNPHVNQRDLATIAKASLGMTNAILKRFAEKGLITIKKVNNRNIRYALTAKGLEEINKRSWSYFKRTIKNVVDYQDAIREIVKQAKADGYEGIALVGKSDLEFMVEHVCNKERIPYKAVKGNESKILNNYYFLLAESRTISESFDLNVTNRFTLNSLIEKPKLDSLIDKKNRVK